MVDIQFFSKITDVNDDNKPLEENAATHLTYNYVDSEAMVSAEEDGYKASITKENELVFGTSTDTVSPVGLDSEHSSDHILSMTKLEDIENFMDTLLDSKLEESSLDDSLQNVPHEAELSTAKPLTDDQLMSELCKFNDKLSLQISPDKSYQTNESYTNKKDSNEEFKKRSNAELSEPFDSCIGTTLFVCMYAA